MAPAALEIPRLQLQLAQLAQVVLAEARELIQQLRQSSAFVLALLRLAVEALEGARLAMLQDHARAGHPIGALAVDEMSDDVEGCPSALAFVGVRPRFGQVAEKRVEGAWSALEQGN